MRPRSHVTLLTVMRQEVMPHWGDELPDQPVLSLQSNVSTGIIYLTHWYFSALPACKARLTGCSHASRGVVYPVGRSLCRRSVHRKLEQPGRQTSSDVVRRSQAGHFHPLGRVFRSRVSERVVLVALAGPEASGRELRQFHVQELPAWVQLPRFRAALPRSVLQSGQLGGPVPSLWRKVSDCCWRCRLPQSKALCPHWCRRSLSSIVTSVWCLINTFITDTSSWQPNTTKALSIGAHPYHGTGTRWTPDHTGTWWATWERQYATGGAPCCWCAHILKSQTCTYCYNNV